MQKQGVFRYLNLRLEQYLNYEQEDCMHKPCLTASIQDQDLCGKE